MLLTKAIDSILNCLKRQDKQKKSALRAYNACVHKQRIHIGSEINAK